MGELLAPCPRSQLGSREGYQRMTWLVTGGAGYIGSHVVRAFEAEGIPAVVIDDLSSGHRDFVRPEVPFYAGSVLERELLDQIFAEQQIAGVVHLGVHDLDQRSGPLLPGLSGNACVHRHRRHI